VSNGVCLPGEETRLKLTMKTRLILPFPAFWQPCALEVDLATTHQLIPQVELNHEHFDALFPVQVRFEY
jgi:hypothetical protein